MNDNEKITEEESLQEEVKTEWTDQIFLNKLLDALTSVKDAGAKYVRCLDCSAQKVDLYNITDIQFTSSLLDPESKAVTKICIIFDDDATKKCETVERFVELLNTLNSKIEENNRNNISVSFALKDPSKKQFKQYRYYYDDTNDTVLLAVNVPQIKLIQAFCVANPTYGNAKVLPQVSKEEVEAQMKDAEATAKEENKDVIKADDAATKKAAKKPAKKAVKVAKKSA